MGSAVNYIFQDKQGNYWFATNGKGAYRFDGITLVQFTAKNGLCDNQVFTIQEDDKSNIWFLTVGGICRFDGKTFKTFPDKKYKLLNGNNDLKMKPHNL
ncbi:MAG: hypothetical protein KA103_03165 [Saprospiraceae bacterium]|nr:hypothetical protein [Saprospiraceae bacterium]